MYIVFEVWTDVYRTSEDRFLTDLVELLYTGMDRCSSDQ